MIPLITLVILWLYQDKPIFFKDGDDGKIGLVLNNRTLISIAICILVSSPFIYYPFLSCFSLIVAGATSYLLQRSKGRLLASLMLIAIIVIGVIINLSPTILYQMEMGKDPEVAARSSQESEYYGLKITQLLMPIVGHRIERLSDFANAYMASTPLP